MKIDQQFDLLVAGYIEQKTSIELAMKFLRGYGYKFTTSHFRTLWRSLRGVPAKTVYTPVIEFDPLLRAPLPHAEPIRIKAAPIPAKGTILSPDATRRTLDGKRFVFTCAQNNTYLHEGFWNGLQTFCKENDAQLGVSRFTYNKAEWQKRGGKSKSPSRDAETIWYDPRIVPYIIDEQVKVAQGLVFCGELDILPTAIMPLNTLSNYTGLNSGIVPHTKMHMQSLATMKHETAKLLYTTGTVTQRNYIQRKTGQVATFHHVFGALYVEVDEAGDWFCRQLMADDDGVFFDLNTAYGAGFTSPASEFGDTYVNLGDIHVEKMDYHTLSGAMEMLKVLKPNGIFLHDLIDFTARNHHNIKDPYFMADRYYSRKDSVESGIAAGAMFAHGISRDHAFSKVYVIRSNHDQAYKRWLQDHKGSEDPANAAYWHLSNYVMHSAIIDGNPDYDIFEWAMRKAETENLLDLSRVKFIKEDESLVINGIEYGMHGHRGPNGSRGNPKAFRQLGRRANTGHTHSAGIIDGVWTAGIIAKLDMDYNVGPSSWSHSHIITYPNGKRCIITQRGKKWRA